MPVQFTMIRSERFKREKAASDAYLTKGRVFLISRFDDDDSTLATIFSMRYFDDVQLEAGSQGGLSSNTRLDPTGVKAAGKQGGGHAEEVFIRSLYKLANEYGNPGKIEVFTSLIPCMYDARHGSNPFKIGNGRIMPAGCGAKLNVLVDLYPGVNWAFAYEADYSKQGGDIHAETTKEMRKLAGKPNASVYRYRSTGKSVHQLTCVL